MEQSPRNVYHVVVVGEYMAEHHCGHAVSCALAQFVHAGIGEEATTPLLGIFLYRNKTERKEGNRRRKGR